MKFFWAVVVTAVAIAGLALQGFLLNSNSTKSPHQVLLRGIPVMGLSRSKLSEEVRKQGATLWKKDRNKDIYVFHSGSEEYPDTLTINFDLFGRVENVSGDACRVSLGSQFVEVEAGAEQTTVESRFGKPLNTIRRTGSKTLLYNGGQVLLMLNKEGFYRFYVSRSAAKRPDLL